MKSKTSLASQLLASALLCTTALSATKTWDGGAVSANWADPANWNSDGVPTSSDAVVLDNSAVTPVPQINAQSGANCGTLTINGPVAGTFLNYAGSTPLPTNFYGTSVNAANTGPLINCAGTTAGTLSGMGDGGKLDIGGSGVTLGGSGNDVVAFNSACLNPPRL